MPIIAGPLYDLIAAATTFVLGHFLLSSLPVRTPLIRHLGMGGFRIVYTVFAIATFAWLLLGYASAPLFGIWQPAGWMRWIPVLTMPFALLLVVGAYTTPNVTAVGGESQSAEELDPAPGIMRITRHPFLMGATLWATSHLLANGDAASIVLFAAILVLSVGGMLHIDHRRRHAMGSTWGPIALTTSVIPFAAILSGRTKPDWAGIGLWRVAAALGLYVVLLVVHQPLFGASPFPV